MYRFTPTGVGTVGDHVANLYRSSVHPHGRGDGKCSPASPVCPFGSPPRAWGRCTHRKDTADVLGSPPRAWGRSVSRVHRAVIRRFTPTGVGTVVTGLARYSSTSVHPHGR